MHETPTTADSVSPWTTRRRRCVDAAGAGFAGVIVARMLTISPVRETRVSVPPGQPHARSAQLKTNRRWRSCGLWRPSSQLRPRPAGTRVRRTAQTLHVIQCRLHA